MRYSTTLARNALLLSLFGMLPANRLSAQSSAGNAPTSGSQPATGDQQVPGQAARQTTQGLETGINPGQVSPNAQAAWSFGGWNQNPWFFDPRIQQQLQLTDEQREQLRHLYSQFWGRYNQGLTGLQDQLGDAGTRLRRRELGQTLQNDFVGSINSLISDPLQRQRFGQLMLQYQGFNAFNDPTVQQRLDLTERQLEQLERLQQDWNEKMQALSDESPRARNIDARFNELRQEAGERIGNVLTDEQRRMWLEMLGTPFDFPPDIYFPATERPNQTPVD